MLQLKNASPFATMISVFPNEHGVDSLYIVIKATFNLNTAQGGALSLAEEQISVTEKDEHWADPTSSLRYASEIHLSKPSTDVIMNGQAQAPQRQKVQQLDVRLSIAEKQKTVRVFGDRHWQKTGLITPPQPFELMPLVYERSYGGSQLIDAEHQQFESEERNPVGLGFFCQGKKIDFNNQPLPNIETPGRLLQKPGDVTNPVGFSYISPTWLPRRHYVGTYDKAWQQTRAPYLPKDFQSKFFNTAHPDFIFDRYLQGGEPVQIDNVSANGPLHFSLPICHLETKVCIAGIKQSPQLNLETVFIEPDEQRVCMTWRATLTCDKKTLKIEQTAIKLLSLKFPGIID